MARLPVSGADNGVWGDILNDYLEVVHNAVITVVAVDAVATGITSGTVIVPSGKNITLTYPSARRGHGLHRRLMEIRRKYGRK